MPLIKLNATQGLTGTLPAVSGANLTNIDGGKIGQVLSVTKTDTTSVTQSGTYADITGMAVGITPSATSSKILCLVSCYPSTQSGYNLMLRLLRGSTNLCIGDASSSRNQASGHLHPNSAYDIIPTTINFLDSPSTTSATTYKLQWRQVDNETAYLNRTFHDDDNIHRPRLASTITVMEILS